jgi:hypothetical protein
MGNLTKENLIPLLEKYYEAFIHEEDVWTFFLELAEYLELLDENKETNKILSGLNEQKGQDLKALGEIEQETLRQLDESKIEILKRLKKHKISSKAIDYALDEIRAMEEGRVWTSQPKADYINSHLTRILEALREEQKDDILKDYKSPMKTSYYPVDDYIFALSLRSYMQLREANSFKEKTTIWYAWDHLQWAYLVIKKSDETLKGIEDKKDRQEKDGFMSLMQEMEKIQNHNERSSFGDKLNPIWFKKNEFIQFARRLHKHIIKSLLESSTQSHHLVEDSPSFDPALGILWIDGKPVKFGTKSSSYHCLRVMFEDKEEASRQWFFSEIAEAIDEAEPKADKLIHNYFNNTIKQKILAETGIKDFFITDNQSAKINEQYLSQKS